MKQNINSGAYVVTFYLDKKTSIKIGKLGIFQFNSGFYYYVGSALKNLQKRVERHYRKDKRLWWHIDYFSIKAQPVDSILIYSKTKIECTISQVLNNTKQFDTPFKRFGSSDCKCYTHLFFSKKFIKIKKLLEEN